MGAGVHGSNRSARIKRRLFEIFEDAPPGDALSLVVGWYLVVLIIANVAAAVVETVGSVRDTYAHLFDAFEYFSVAVFTLEYLMRLWVADLHAPLSSLGPLRARLRFAAQPSAIIDLLAIAPFYLALFGIGADLRVLRMFRLVRFLKLARYSSGLRSLLAAMAEESRALLGAFVVMTGVALTAATLLYLLEHQVHPDGFGSIPQALWWAIATLTTVGYGDVVPVTPVGKLVGSMVMLLGLMMFALPVGIVATAFAREMHKREFVVTWSMLARVPMFAELSANEIATVMKLLFRLGADPNARDTQGLTVLHGAADSSNDPEVITALVNAGGDLLARDLDGSTPLHRAACFNKNASVIRALIRAGSDVNGQDKWGNTPYDIAVKEGNEAAMEVLKEAGAERSKSSNDW